MNVHDSLSNFFENTQPDQLVVKKVETVSIFSLFDRGRGTYEGEILRALFSDDGFLALLKKLNPSLHKKIRQNLSRNAVFGNVIEEDMKLVAPQLIQQIEDEITLVLSVPRPLIYRLQNGGGGVRIVSVPKKPLVSTLEEILLIHERNGCLTSLDFKKATRAGFIRTNLCRWSLIYLFLTKKEQKIAHDRFLLWLRMYSQS